MRPRITLSVSTSCEILFETTSLTNVFLGEEIYALIIAALGSLLILQTLGVIYFIWKVKSSAKRAFKKDVNPLYGIEAEEEEGNKIPRSNSANYDYMGN